MAFPRTLAVLAAASLVVVACSHRDNRSGSSSTTSSSATSQSPTAAPVPSACGDPGTLPVRDKLAQLLMVGVRNAEDARAVVTEQHVGGIMIDTDTDKSMLTSSALKDLENAPRPLPLAVSVDEEGGRVSRLKALIGSSPSPRELARTQTVDQVYNLALDRGRKMKDLGITVDLAPVVDVTDAPTGMAPAIRTPVESRRRR
jgi:beta-N-acetylhexosaminidase